MSKDKILIEAGDEHLSRLVSQHLEYGGYETSWSFNAEDLHRQLQRASFALVILDTDSPGKDGISLTRKIRQYSDIPIIFLSSKTDLADKVSALDTGADDYITRPYEQAELLARIRSVLRRSRPVRSHQQNKTLARFSGWKLNLVDQTLSSSEDKLVEITSSEFHLLYALIRNPDAVITRDTILNVVSGRKWSPLDRSADMAISKLRKKIEADPHKPVLIRTVRNKGYQLAVAVKFED